MPISSDSDTQKKSNRNMLCCIVNIYKGLVWSKTPKQWGHTTWQRCISATTEAAAQSDAILYFLVFSGALVPIPFEMLWSEAGRSSKTSYKYTWNETVLDRGMVRYVLSTGKVVQQLKKVFILHSVSHFFWGPSLRLIVQDKVLQHCLSFKKSVI